MNKNQIEQEFAERFQVFEQCGVQIVDLRKPDSNKLIGRLEIRWTESDNRGMLNIFDYEGLDGRKSAMVDVLKFAAEVLLYPEFY